MPTPQSTILPEGASACLVFEADVAAEKAVDIASVCAKIAALLQKHRDKMPNIDLALAIGFGFELWQKFRKNDADGGELKRFYPLGGGLAPATQHDLAIHIQSKNQGANLALAVQVLELFGDLIQVADETQAHRLPEDRGFDGFVDGTENPTGEKRAFFAAIAEPAIDAGGSYLLLQKYRHDMKKWNKLDDDQQAHVIGRTKADNIEFSKEQRAPDSHLGRVNLKENGQGLKIIRQSLPYGQVSGEHGLLFIAYCARLYNIEQQLLSMFGETDGKIDLVLKHLSLPISGSYYFVPSEERLANLLGR